MAERTIAVRLVGCSTHPGSFGRIMRGQHSGSCTLSVNNGVFMAAAMLRNESKLFATLPELV